MSYSDVKKKYLEAICRFAMLKGCSRVLVGFSGGSDSSLLLSLMHDTQGIEVAAAHLNHCIRGAEADRDEGFCIDFCRSRGIPIYTKKVDIPFIAKCNGLTVEEAARNERYAFFDNIASEHSYELIATAHNADDCIETMLFNLVRGTAINGLCGIPPTRDNIIRPLILLSKNEINSACAEASIPYVTDSTNSDTAYTRNYIRHNIVPKLRELNPSLYRAVSSCTASLRRDRDCLDEISSSYSFSDGREVLSGLNDAILSRVICNELEKVGSDYGSKHIEDAIELIRSDEPHTRLSLPSCELICDRNLIKLESSFKHSISLSIPLKNGINDIGGYCTICIGNNEKDINTLKNIYKLSIHVTANSAKISSGCSLRLRQDGDTYRINGMTKKVKKMLQSLKLPSSYTGGIPFIVNADNVLYIPHFSVSDHIKPTELSEKTDIYYFYN